MTFGIRLNEFSFVCGVLGNSGELFCFVSFVVVGTEEKQSDTSEHALSLQRGEVRRCRGDEV